LDKGLAFLALALGLGFGGFLTIAAFFLSRPRGASSSASPQALKLVVSKSSSPKVQASDVILNNLERIRTIRDDEGRLVELEIHREVRR